MSFLRLFTVQCDLLRLRVFARVFSMCHLVGFSSLGFFLLLLQTVFSVIVLAVSLLITLVSVVMWQRNVRHHPAGSRYTPVASTPSSAADDTSPASVMEDALSVQGAASSPLQSPSQQTKNYQTCAASLNCSGESDYF